MGEATRQATDFVSQSILSGGDKTKLEEEFELARYAPVRPTVRVKYTKSSMFAGLGTVVRLQTPERPPQEPNQVAQRDQLTR